MAKVKPIGVFVVKAIQDNFIEFDPYEKGSVEVLENYQAQGYQEVDAEGNVKDFDGFSVGDFFKFDGSYELVRTNEMFSKIQVENYLISIPNHKLIEVTDND